MQNKKVIIFATTYYPLVAGAEVAMKELTDRLPDWEFDLICARIQPGLPSTERIGRVTVHRCGLGYPIDKYLLPVIGPICAVLLPESQDAAVWSLMASYGGFAALVYTWLCPRVKMLLTLQEGDPLEHYAARAGALNFLHRMIFQRANIVQAISTFLAKWAKDMGAKSESVVIPNGVEVNRFASRISDAERHEMRNGFGFSDSDVVVVTVSRLHQKNAVDDLIRSLASSPSNVKALIAGDGDERDALHAIAEKMNLRERVVFLGNKSQEELPAILQSADIFCRPSLSEGLGISFLEAMASGLPIIATPVGGIPDFLRDGETGVFCQPRDPASIARAVERIQSYPGLREKLVRQGEALVRKSYDWDTIAQDINGLLNRLSAS